MAHPCPHQLPLDTSQSFASAEPHGNRKRLVFAHADSVQKHATTYTYLDKEHAPTTGLEFLSDFGLELSEDIAVDGFVRASPYPHAVPSHCCGRSSFSPAPMHDELPNELPVEEVLWRLVAPSSGGRPEAHELQHESATSSHGSDSSQTLSLPDSHPTPPSSPSSPKHVFAYAAHEGSHRREECEDEGGGYRRLEHAYAYPYARHDDADERLYGQRLGGGGTERGQYSSNERGQYSSGYSGGGCEAYKYTPPHERECATLGRLEASAPVPSAQHNRKEWAVFEDDVIREGVRELGMRWRAIAAKLPGRSDDAVRNRWARLQGGGSAGGLLNPMGCAKAGIVKPAGGVGPRPKREAGQTRQSWTSHEDMIILSSVAEYGRRWNRITQRLPKRTEHAIRNRWHRLQMAAIDERARQRFEPPAELDVGSLLA
uniref:Uncharacterized protein n=1 Tax=Coccolithus braarudii TaxID=221442 RepID=A0A7S0LT39_9EUKA